MLAQFNSKDLAERVTSSWQKFEAAEVAANLAEILQANGEGGRLGRIRVLVTLSRRVFREAIAEMDIGAFQLEQELSGNAAALDDPLGEAHRIINMSPQGKGV